MLRERGSIHPEAFDGTNDTQVAIEVARLHNVGVSVFAVASLDVHGGGGIRQDNDRNGAQFRVSFDRPKHLITSHSWKIQIEQNQIRQQGLLIRRAMIKEIESCVTIAYVE